MKIELIIQNGETYYMPVLADNAVWSTDRKGSPGKLTVTVVKDQTIDFHEGNPVRLSIDGKPIFYGFVFTKKRDKKHHIAVTAYDQIRYLLNKDTYTYKSKTAGEVVEMIAADYNLKLGEIEKTGFRIAKRSEKDSTLLDIIYNALDQELLNNGKMYVLYDDFGKLTLKSLDSMKLDLLIDDASAENFDYSTSIDEKTYNRVKLAFDNEKAGQRDIFIAQDGENINRWGILQFTDTLKEGENGESKADALLDLYNVKTRKLKVSKVRGDIRVRAGGMVLVKLGVGDMNVQNYMLAEKAVHTFGGAGHSMDLTLRGGEFIV